MKRISIISILIIISLASTLSAQEVRFGKNKVRYKDFDWSFIQTRHFDVYFYENAYPTAKFAASVMESAYVEITEELDYVVRQRIPIFIYNSHNDFQQTNIIPSILPEGVGGFTEAFKNRIVIPFTGSYEDFRHVLHHELTHAVIYDFLFGQSFSSLLSRQRLFNLPLWFAEGYAEYSSRHGWDYFSDMYVRDATINGYLAPPLYLGGFLAYKQGQAMVKFIADKYGEKKLGDILRKGKIHLTLDKALKSSIGITEEELFKEFAKEMKRRYWPEIARRKEADEVAKQLTKARKDGSFFNDRPAFSPEGDKLAIFTDKSDYAEIVLISAADGKHIKKLVKAERSGDLESLHWYFSGVSFSPDGRKIVYVAKSKGKESIFMSDVGTGKIYHKRRMDFYNILSPTWSPDGNKIAFSALDGFKRDLYIYNIETDEVEQITDDRFDDVDPSWLPNSSEIVFSSDRPHPSNPAVNHLGHPYVQEGARKPGDFDYGTYNIFRVETAGLRVTPVDVGPGQNKGPTVTKDGSRIAFISNRNGTDNIYIGYLDSTKYYAVTDLLTGVRSLSWSPDGRQIAFSTFFRGSFDVFLLKEISPTGESGVLTTTDYVQGKYNLLDPSKKGMIAHRKKANIEKSDIEDTALVKQDDSTAIATTIDSLPSTEVLADSQPDSSASKGTTAMSTDLRKTDSLTTKDTDSTGQDEPELATADSSKTDSADSVITETGIYDDDYVFISDRDDDRIDSLFTDVVETDSSYFAKSLEEPALFDSVPPLLPDGEFRVNKYKVKFTPDFVGGGFAYDTFFGLRGQSVFVFSDYLGNHQIIVSTDLVNSIDQSFVQAFYLNSRRRTNYGGGFFHTKNFYIDNRNFLFSDRFYGAQGFLSRPFSTFSRLEFSASQVFIDRKYYDRSRGDTRQDRNAKATTGELAWVFDNVLWGSTGPVNGRRAKFGINSTINLFNTKELEFYSIDLDYRRYWHFAKTFSMALRFSGGASYGNTPKQYFLGGTTNWIGNSRALDTEVYNVENLYFSDVITPLRSEGYYDLAGDHYALVNWEFRFPFVQYFALRYPLPIVFSNIVGVLFTDVGTAWDGASNIVKDFTNSGDNRWDDVKTGFGVGARLNVFGFMLLRYDLAWSTDWQRVSAHPRSFFSFGADF